MNGNFLENAEEQELFRPKQKTQINQIFSVGGSAGIMSDKLARILAAFDMAMNSLGWQDKPLAHFSTIVRQHQASVDGKYHNDFKEVLIAEEIERRREERKEISILQS